jgi:hypothetical protein
MKGPVGEVAETQPNQHRGCQLEAASMLGSLRFSVGAISASEN